MRGPFDPEEVDEEEEDVFEQGVDKPPFEPDATPDITKLEYREFTDTAAQRKAIFDRVRSAYSGREYERDGFRLQFADVDYDQKQYTLKDEKDAVLGRKRLYWPLRGRLRLVDPEGNVVKEDPKKRTIAQVPYMTRRGTFIHNGNEYAVANQQRLRPGIYTRRQTSGNVESQFNVLPGTGRGFRIHMDPDTGVFRLQVGQSNMKLYPVLKDMGFSEKDLKEAWGKEIYGINVLSDDKGDRKTLPHLVAKLGGPQYANLPPDEAQSKLKELFEKMRMDSDVNRRTMGEPFERVDGQTLLASTKRILGVNRGESEVDERDDLPFQSFHSAEDFFSEHVEKDSGQLIKNAFWKMKNGRDVPPNYFTKQLQSVLLDSGVAAPLSEINPVEILDARHKILRLGEGGLSSTQVVPRGARGVQPTHFGFIDPIKAPESTRIGLDMRLAQGVVRGSDGNLYSQVVDTRTGGKEFISVNQFIDSPVAFPGEVARAKNRYEKMGAPEGTVPKARAMKGGKLSYVPITEINYELPEAGNMFTPGTNFVPFASAAKGQRILMGSRMQSQALPLEKPESPLVQVKAPGSDKSMNQLFAKEMGAVFAEGELGGHVSKVTPDLIRIRYDDGTVKDHELYNNHPFNQKTSIHNTPLVQQGHRIKPGQILASSNYTDENGELALGKNLRVAYHMMDGMTHEDAVVVSESTAKKFSSEQLYTQALEKSDTVDEISKKQFVTKYPGVFTAEQLSSLDDTGVVKPGTVVKQGDPLILAVGKKRMKVKGSLMRSSKSEFVDAAETWEHETPGQVVDVYKTSGGWRVATKTYTPVRVGDKFAGSYGNKGVVTRVVPDEEMPTDESGQPIELVLNPMGIISRVNPSQLIESALGKVAQKTGKKYILPSFSEDNLTEFALQELEKHGLKDTETITDPRTGRKIEGVSTGVQNFFKLHHLAESKLNARSMSGYSMDDTPAKGGYEGAKRLGTMEMFSLLSHGAHDVIRDAKMVRGQRNDDYWQLYRLGMTPPEPRVSGQYRKFEAFLQGSGINLRKSGSKTQLLPMTDSDVALFAGDREITKGDTVNFDNGNPVPGGLFDIGMTGGADGTKWSFVKLPEPMPNPIMEDPIKALLGLTGPKFEAVLSGEEALDGKTGGAAIKSALSKLNVDREIATAKELIKEGKKTHRDKAVKRLGILKSLKDNSINPSDLVMEKVPILPPKWRPVSRAEGVELVSDVNQLYKELIEAKDNYTKAKELFGTPGDTRLDLYKSFKAATGMGNPITQESQQRGLKGLLKSVLGDSPKYGLFQRRVLGQTVDMTGRGVIVPEPDYDIDELGIPDEAAWDTFKPFIIREMVRRGMGGAAALKAFESRSPVAKEARLKAMKERPVIINRAPSLWKHNMTAHYAKPVAGNALRLPIAILAGHNADFDGDAVNFHVPVSDKAVEQAREKMLPSRNLYSAKDFKVHMMPNQGFTLGLYLGTKGDNGKPRRTFESTQDVLEAYRRGEIGPRDRVTVKRAK